MKYFIRYLFDTYKDNEYFPPLVTSHRLKNIPSGPFELFTIEIPSMPSKSDFSIGDEIYFSQILNDTLTDHLGIKDGISGYFKVTKSEYLFQINESVKDVNKVILSVYLVST